MLAHRHTRIGFGPLGYEGTLSNSKAVLARTICAGHLQHVHLARLDHFGGAIFVQWEIRHSGYTMPIFSALIGAFIFHNQLSKRAWGGVAAAALGVILLLWHELVNLSGKPLGVVLALVAASTWALGTQMLRRTTIPLPTLTLSFWMTAMTTLVISVLAFVFESDRWQEPTPVHWLAILYNALLVFGFAHSAWFYLARGLPPVASTLSVMMIPILGVFSGAWALNEVLHWQDWAAMGLMLMSIASVLWPSQPTEPAKTEAA